MNKDKLHNHISSYIKYIEDNQSEHVQHSKERIERVNYYQSFTAHKIVQMTEESFSEYISKLWAMLIWGNKHYVVNKLMQDNGFKKLKTELASLVWGEQSVAKRWDHFRENIKGMGPAMMSEILSHVHPNECMLWNRRAYVGLNSLGIKNLPRYNYQLTGDKYEELSNITGEIADELENAGLNTVNLLTVDYFIWHELQNDVPLEQVFKNKPNIKNTVDKSDKKTSDFVHNEIRDKVAEIGIWLGLDSQTEIKVSQGSKVDAVWESTIGNMGRVIYVFEVQTKGSIDSLIVNLSKSLKNPAVQGVVAVSDAKQIEKIKRHAADMPGLNEKLKYWDYEDVLKVHDALELVNESINSLGLVPQGF